MARVSIRRYWADERASGNVLGRMAQHVLNPQTDVRCDPPAAAYLFFTKTPDFDYSEGG